MISTEKSMKNNNKEKAAESKAMMELADDDLSQVTGGRPHEPVPEYDPPGGFVLPYDDSGE